MNLVPDSLTESNYLDEKIPSFEKLQYQAKKFFESLISKKRYGFAELFLIQDSGEYNRNSSLFESIGYNTKSKKERQQNNEIRGIYIFYENDVPIYVGISRGILRRLKNHFLGKTHFEASLAYLIARNSHDNEIGIYMGERSKFPFDKYLSNIQSDMRQNWKISIIPIEDSYEMYFTEFYLACEMKTKWNSFETH